MGIFLKAVGIGIALSGIKKVKNKWDEEERQRKEEENRRINSVCTFDDISEAEFREMVQRARKGIKRISSLQVEGPMIYGTVRSQSGISDWDFKIDFNDYGNLTGSYWLSFDNKDSNIPTVLANRIVKQINDYPEGFEDSFQKETCKEKKRKIVYTRILGYCPCCGKEITDENATECEDCGWRFQI